MRTEAETAAHGRMTRRAVAFGMTRGTRLETLPRRLPMPEAEPAEDVVISSGSKPPLSDEPRLLMACLTELRRIVTVGAVRFARVRRAGMARDKVLRMIARLRSGIRPVTLEARRASMTCLASSRTCVRFGPVSLPEIESMSAWRRACQLRATRAVSTGDRQCRNHSRLRANVTRHAALASVTCGARSGSLLRITTMMPQESSGRVTCRNGLRECVCRRAIVEREGRDNRILRCIDVTRKTQIPRVTCRAVRGDTDLPG